MKAAPLNTWHAKSYSHILTAKSRGPQPLPRAGAWGSQEARNNIETMRGDRPATASVNGDGGGSCGEAAVELACVNASDLPPCRLACSNPARTPMPARASEPPQQAQSSKVRPSLSTASMLARCRNNHLRTSSCRLCRLAYAPRAVHVTRLDNCAGDDITCNTSIAPSHAAIGKHRECRGKPIVSKAFIMLPTNQCTSFNAFVTATSASASGPLDRESRSSHNTRRLTITANTISNNVTADAGDSGSERPSFLRAIPARSLRFRRDSNAASACCALAEFDRLPIATVKAAANAVKSSAHDGDCSSGSNGHDAPPDLWLPRPLPCSTTEDDELAEDTKAAKCRK
mmetsp:Transcript_46372/g.72324  ORF Transcript_46372/g.72324 Transcript_46372/m.72324 type:complete len:343 (+) Transcript_46372:2303-3331(+)